MAASAYPLEWPSGWPRASIRKDRGPFKTTFDDARRKLYYQLEKLGAEHVVVSSWIPLRLDGNPRADMARRPLADPGVAVYFTVAGRPMVMARDAFRDVHDNLMSIVHAIDHLRGLERHGGGIMMERAFTGFTAITDTPHWRSVLKVDNGATRRDAEENYRFLAKRYQHDHDRMVELNLSIEQARKELS